MHPFHNVAIVGVHNTGQARLLDGHTSESITAAAIRGALEDAGLAPSDIDGVSVLGQTLTSADLVYSMGLGPARATSWPGIPLAAVIDSAAAVATGQCDTVLVANGQAGEYVERASTAPWTRPSNEFVECWGLYTAAEFALIARRHMYLYGTKPEQMATVAATIRNNGHINPEAVYYGKGPFTPEDILNSRMVADPFHLLDCAMTSEGGCAVILTTTERARDMKQKPVFVLGGAFDYYGPAYTHPPSWDLAGWVGREAAKKAFRMAGVSPQDVDVCEFYDPFSFEIIRQFEAFGFCGEGEGGDFVMGGRIELTGRHPICTDGGLLSHSHTGVSQMLQKVVAAVRQLRGEAGNRQVKDARVAMCTNGGAGALHAHALLLGNDKP